MPEIAGKQVEFRERMTSRQWWPVYYKIITVPAGEMIPAAYSFDEAVQLCMAVVESWEFDGDPQDPGAYEHLGGNDEQTVTIFLALLSAAYRHAVSMLNKHLPEDQGESGGRSTRASD